MAYLLEAFAALAATRRQPERAQQLAGAAAALREASGSTLMPSEALALDAVLDAARQALGAERSAALWAAGRAMGADRAVEYALEPALPAPTPLRVASSETAARRSRELAESLTTREQEIAAYVARGLSNREVAEALVVSRRTVEWHLANLLAKLGLRSRIELVRRVVEHGDADLAEVPSADKPRVPPGVAAGERGSGALSRAGH